jgi:hypothetical protein
MKILEWDVERIANALQIPAYSVERLFRDGRSLQPLVEARILSQWPGLHADLTDYGTILVNRESKRQKVRCLSRYVSFTPSDQRGKGRSFDLRAFINYLQAIDIFLVPDVETFPIVEVHEVTSEEILALQLSPIMNKGTINRADFLAHYKET